MVIQIRVNQQDLRRVSGRVRSIGRLPEEISLAGKNWLKIVQKSVAQQLMIEKAENRSQAPRGEMKQTILAPNRIRKLSKNSYVFVVPPRASKLDLGMPNRVNLRSNARARKWANQYYNQRNIRRVRRSALASKVVRGRKGTVVAGQLVIVPHPFVQKGISKVRNRLRGEVKKAVQKNLRRTR